ncbi:MAG: hypothetical protein QNJ34_15880 [Xenococcaceae cyanobacterium MO_188.B29]|nr:hypothetical protein [Xenococcaceae cyanobacterium MO_188.B29]
MGDINFTIAKDVNLNKVVNLDIDKDVDVNVDNPDQLATAEADAEAFGEQALAETDAYTYVTDSEAFSYAESTAALDLEIEEPIFDDPLGDTFGFGSPQIDIENVSGVVSGEELKLTMNFFTPISAPSTGLSDSVVGFWDLDLDQDPLTGIASNQSFFAPPDQQGGPLGVEVVIDLFSEEFNPGFVDLFDTNGFFIGTAPITYGTNSLEISIPLSELGDDGNLNYGTVIGTFNEPTDAAPNGVFGTVGESLSSLQNIDAPISDGALVWASIPAE